MVVNAFHNLISNLVIESLDWGLTAMTRTEIGLAIFVSGKPAVASILEQPLQTVCHLIDCQWRGGCRYQSTDGLATAVFFFALLHCEQVTVLCPCPNLTLPVTAA